MGYVGFVQWRHGRVMICNIWLQLENHFQLHEQQRLLPQTAEHNQYTSFPPRNHRSPGTVRARAGDRGQYSQVFERAPASPRAATLGRVKRSALADGKCFFVSFFNVAG